MGFGANLTDFAALPALVARIEGAMGLATHLVNVAGIIRRTADLFSVNEADWDAQHDVNLKALFFLTQAFAARLKDEGCEGSVVNYSSQGWQSGGFGGSVVYNATKGAITTMTRGMARSWAPLGYPGQCAGAGVGRHANAEDPRPDARAVPGDGGNDPDETAWRARRPRRRDRVPVQPDGTLHDRGDGQRLRRVPDVLGFSDARRALRALLPEACPTSA
jgi:NAD(P)-dependent dehydrogenase (short-subunit alcohol dehydrogenase family)